MTVSLHRGAVVFFALGARFLWKRKEPESLPDSETRVSTGKCPASLSRGLSR